MKILHFIFTLAFLFTLSVSQTTQTINEGDSVTKSSGNQDQDSQQGMKGKKDSDGSEQNRDLNQVQGTNANSDKLSEKERLSDEIIERTHLVKRNSEVKEKEQDNLAQMKDTDQSEGLKKQDPNKNEQLNDKQPDQSTQSNQQSSNQSQTIITRDSDAKENKAEQQKRDSNEQSQNSYQTSQRDSDQVSSFKQNSDSQSSTKQKEVQQDITIKRDQSDSETISTMHRKDKDIQEIIETTHKQRIYQRENFTANFHRKNKREQDSYEREKPKEEQNISQALKSSYDQAELKIDDFEKKLDENYQKPGKQSSKYKFRESISPFQNQKKHHSEQIEKQGNEKIEEKKSLIDSIQLQDSVQVPITFNKATISEDSTQKFFSQKGKIMLQQPEETDRFSLVFIFVIFFTIILIYSVFFKKKAEKSNRKELQTFSTVIKENDSFY